MNQYQMQRLAIRRARYEEEVRQARRAALTNAIQWAIVAALAAAVAVAVAVFCRVKADERTAAAEMARAHYELVALTGGVK